MDEPGAVMKGKEPGALYQKNISKSLGHTLSYKHLLFLAISFQLAPNSGCMKNEVPIIFSSEI
jgi:hypothetical protein